MTDEHRLFERGFEEVLAGLEQDEGDLNVDVLAQACSREARAPSTSREASLGWARASIGCYEEASHSRKAGYDRQGSEVPLFGLIALMILTWGGETGDSVLDPERLNRWVQEGLEQQESPGRFREALRETTNSSRREHAVCLMERLEVALPLYERGLLRASFEPWLRSAGLLVGEGDQG